MSTRLVIPKGATIEHQKSGVMDTGAYTGYKVELTLWHGHASDGYKTGYQRRPARWLELKLYDPRGKFLHRYAWRYAGKNYEKGLSDFEADAVHLQPAPEHQGEEAIA